MLFLKALRLVLTALGCINLTFYKCNQLHNGSTEGHTVSLLDKKRVGIILKRAENALGQFKAY